MVKRVRLALAGRASAATRSDRPVTALLDLLGRRWVLRILWELHEQPARSFRALQARCGDVSSSVLNQRLRELREAGLLRSGEASGYALTERGQELLDALAPIDAWAKRWAPRRPGRR